MALSFVPVRELDVFAVKGKCHCCDTHYHEEDRGWHIIFCRAAGWHEYREIHRYGAGVDNQEKPPQLGENLQHILDQGMMAEASLYEEIERNINKRYKKRADPNKEARSRMFDILLHYDYL